MIEPIALTLDGRYELLFPALFLILVGVDIGYFACSISDCALFLCGGLGVSDLNGSLFTIYINCNRHF